MKLRATLAFGLAASASFAACAVAAPHARPVDVARAASLPPGCRPLPPIEAQALSAEAADRLRGLPSTARGASAGELVLRDGRLLLQPGPGEPGVLLTPAARAVLRRAEAESWRARGLSGPPAHALDGLIDDADAFVRDAPRLAARFRERLAAARLDPGAPASVDALARRYAEARCLLDPAFFRELTAWVGERAIARHGGTWAARELPGDPTRREPVVERPAATTPGAAASDPLRPWRQAEELLSGEAPPLDELIDRDLGRDPGRDPSAPSP